MISLAAMHLRYRVDGDGYLTYLSEGWNEFAVANGAPELDAESIIGRPLAGFIDGDEAQLLWRGLIDLSKHSGRTLTIPFRCDSPGARRIMRMTIRAVDGGETEFSTQTVAVENRNPVSLLNRWAVRSPDTMLKLCSWCNRGLVRDEWLELDDVVSALNIFDVAALPALTHGICPGCHRDIEQQFLNP